MLTKTKIALAATLFAATSSVAMAQGYDPNMANRDPQFANAQAYGVPNATFQSAQVQLRQGRNAGVTSEQPRSTYRGATEIDVDRADRTSSPYAGGGY